MTIGCRRAEENEAHCRQVRPSVMDMDNGRPALLFDETASIIVGQGHQQAHEIAMEICAQVGSLRVDIRGAPSPMLQQAWGWRRRLPLHDPTMSTHQLKPLKEKQRRAKIEWLKARFKSIFTANRNDRRTRQSREAAGGRLQEGKELSAMNQTIFILAGTSREYTTARQELKLTPPQARWLTGASLLKGLSGPIVYRVGAWRTLMRIEAIEAAMAEVNAKIVDL